MDSAPRPISRAAPLDPLRGVLRANGIFCAVAGVTALTWASRLGPLLGLPPVVLTAVGAVTAGYAVVLFVSTSRRAGPTLLEWSGWTTFFVDAFWVLGTLSLLLGDWGDLVPLTGAGRWAIAGVGDVVALFTGLELWALRRRGAFRSR